MTPVVYITGGLAAAYSANDTTHLSEVGYKAQADHAIDVQGIHLLAPAAAHVTPKSKLDPEDGVAGAGVINGKAPGWNNSGGTALALAAKAAGDTVSSTQWVKFTRPAAVTADTLFYLVLPWQPYRMGNGSAGRFAGANGFQDQD